MRETEFTDGQSVPLLTETGKNKTAAVFTLNEVKTAAVSPLSQ